MAGDRRSRCPERFRRRSRRVAAALLVCCAVSALWLAPALARSALSPRHSGMEPPGGPRPLESMPGNAPSRTAEGGMGYTDAYGNTLDERQPPEKAPRKRPRAGAYGGYGGKAEVPPLPDPAAENRPPVWTFN
ncbi:translation initiation factor IF-2 [uncultured Desulfovibrio sp.]|uniref:translation initiation factor IF-2 n=1 Tax=uncultured Desulfovibrio sp. TaxID=167968 RepID=UPI0025FB5D2B|nr:translation initiation factor IF-2 [uncultured Desulfovibrio sp.]